MKINKLQTKKFYDIGAWQREPATEVIKLFYGLSCFDGSHDIQHNDIQHNDIQHNDIQHNHTQHNDTHHFEIQHNGIQHNDTQHNDTQHNDTQHNDIQHNHTQHNDTQHNDIQHNNTQHEETQHNIEVILTFIITTPSITALSTEFHYAEWYLCCVDYAECRI
jgi:hypothetical protein